MAEEKESRIKYLGQIITLFALEILILLFRIAVPVSSTIGGVGEEYKWFIGEMIYMFIQGFLIVILVNHLIFKNPYRKMGLSNFKENIFSFIGNLFYLGIAAGVNYGLNYISGTINTYSITYMITHVVVTFISIAFLQEIIYRGCILNAFLKLTQRKAILSIIGATLLFVVIHVPLTLLESYFECLFTGSMSGIILVSVSMGIYLSLLYYWTNNLWICIIIHGTYSAIDIVGNGLLLPVFKAFYVFCAVIYLIYEAIRYMRGSNVDEEDEEDEIDHDTEKIVEPDEVCKLNEAYESYITQKIEEDKQQEMDMVSEEIMSRTEFLSLYGDVHQEIAVASDEAMLTEAEGELEYQMIQGIEGLSMEAVETKNEEVYKQEETTEFLEDLSQTAIIPIEDQRKDLSQIEIISLGETNANISQTSIIPLQEPTIDLNQTAIINLQELEEANQKSINQEMPKSKISEEEKKAKFKEEPSYMNHLERSLGEFENIYKQVIPTDPPIDILSFNGERFNALVTNGMRYVPMNVPDYLKGNAYAELVMFVDKSFDLSDEGLLREENSWLLQSLRDLAMYPRLTDSYLCWGHTVANGEERMPYYAGTTLCGMLVYPPVVQDDMKFYTFKEGERTTYIYNVMPLYTEEIDFILKKSGDAYFARIKELGISQIITKNRPNICL